MEQPKLRPVEVLPVPGRGGEVVCLRDPTGLSEHPVAVSMKTLFVLSLFDGGHSRLDIQAAYTRRFGDLLFSHDLNTLIAQLDEAYLLESERFRERERSLAREFAELKTRPAGQAGGGYVAEPEKLRGWLDDFFVGEGRCGPIAPERRGDTVRAVIAPHIDLHRGGPCYAWAYKALAEGCGAECFVILGIAHQGLENLFALTRKGFETPLGTVAADEAFIARLSEHAAADLLAEEFAHKREHSVEFHAVFLQHLLGGKRDLRIVPVLCGSFVDLIPGGKSPMDNERVADFVGALRRAIEMSERKVCVIASADLAHVGRQFGDEVGMTPGLLDRVREADRELLACVEAMDAEGFFQRVKRDDNPLHVCGYPAIYTLMQVVDAQEAQLLNHAQAVTEETQSVVSFASVSFEQA